MECKQEGTIMQPNSFFQLCVYICIGLIVFNLSISFVAGLGAFDTSTPAGMIRGNTTDAKMENLSINATGMNDIWDVIFNPLGLATIGALAGGVAVMILTQSVTFLGLYIFFTTYWGSYLIAISTLNLFSYMPAAFLLLITVPIAFIFVAAIIGILAGSG